MRVRKRILQVTAYDVGLVHQLHLFSAEEPDDTEINMLIISSRREGEPNDQITFKWPINANGGLERPEIKQYPMTVPNTFIDRKD